MRLTTPMMSLCALILLASCDQNKNGQGNANSSAAGAAQSGPPMPADESDICTQMSNNQSELDSLIQQINSESNPVRHIDLEQRIEAKRLEIRQYKRTTYAGLTDMRGWVGTISAMPSGNGNRGPDVGLSIAVPCPSSVTVAISFSFVDIQTPGWGGLNAGEQPLSNWRTTLENLSVGNTVVFDAQHVPNNYEGDANEDPSLPLAGSLISIRK